MTLHTLNRPPSDRALLDDCIAALVADDTLLLLEDGVYCALAGLELPAGVRCVALAADVAARGIGDRLATGIEVVDDIGFVELCCHHSRVASWF
ncbi:hypothetical protein GCM10011348_05930 [Marinobacterium nitratireducens]|uniref:Sulfurtransferase complex subunit TusB n=1 Tax=Marinobacterium nitratireducens TaxID=518897 RepID=A0A917ZA46_9GAMM|nr:sulfurtransferase complex subunit TusB [Marinobacterium nitratireducens]GGO77108.1 hypothetical protein GCM10011348_05930 [Marinobacterium nitratireducens]